MMSMEESARATCPVCGQAVDPGLAPSVTYQGKAYYFECQRCVQRFVLAPELFVGDESRNKGPSANKLEAPGDPAGL